MTPLTHTRERYILWQAHGRATYHAFAIAMWSSVNARTDHEQGMSVLRQNT